jgi:hypothetical protein
MHRAWLTGLALVLPLVFAACGARTEAGPRTASDRLTPAEIERYSNLYEAVQALRLTWLQPRTRLRLDPRGVSDSGAVPANPVWTYRDGTRLGGPEALRRISTTEIERVEYYNARAASHRWGINHENGAINVISRRSAIP